jgi:O-antigen ligase
MRAPFRSPQTGATVILSDMAGIGRWVALGALFLIPFVPLFVANDLFFPFITGKGFLFRILVGIAATGWLILALADKRYRPRFSLGILLYGLLVLWMFIADLLAVNPHKAFWSNYERMDGWVTMVHVFLLFLVASSVLTATNLWRRWWLVFLSGATLVCGYGLLQVLGVLETHQGGERIDASFGNAAYLPAYLLFVIAIALWQALSSKGWVRTALLALAGVSTFVLFMTATRGALFGLVGALAFGAFLWLAARAKRGRWVAAGVMLAVVAVGGAFFAVKDTPFVHESRTLSRLSSVFSLSKELAVRADIWGIAVAGSMERPLTGYGHEGFNYVFNANYRPDLFEQEQWFDRAHNVYLDWLIAGGIPALALFLGLMLWASLALFRKEFSLTERVMILAAFAAYAIQGIAVFDNLFTYVPLAMLLAYIHSRIGTPIGWFERLLEARGSAFDGAAIASIAVGAIVIWSVNVPSVLAARKIIESYAVADPAVAMSKLSEALSLNPLGRQEIREQMVTHALNAAGAPNLSAATRTAVVGKAVEEMGRQAEETPLDARIHVQYALLYRGAGDAEGSLREIDAALALSPGKQTIIVDRGMTYWLAGRYQEAKASFYEAYNLDTRFPVLAAYAAAGEILTGNPEAAKGLLDTFYDASRTGMPEAVLYAYDQVGDTAAVVSIRRARIAAEPENADKRFELAAYYAQHGAYGEARNEVAEIIRLLPAAAGVANQWLREIDALKK